MSLCSGFKVNDFGMATVSFESMRQGHWSVIFIRGGVVKKSFFVRLRLGLRGLLIGSGLIKVSFVHRN